MTNGEQEFPLLARFLQWAKANVDPDNPPAFGFVEALVDKGSCPCEWVLGVVCACIGNDAKLSQGFHAEYGLALAANGMHAPDLIMGFLITGATLQRLVDKAGGGEALVAAVKGFTDAGR
jgi:hypothetical protein